MKNPAEQLTTSRLRLRRFTLDDVAATAQLCNNINLYQATANLPYPYTEDHATSWITSHQKAWEEGLGFEWALVDKKTDQLLGCVGIFIDKEHQRGEIGYWIGEPFWNQGYASEAAQAIINHGFEELQLNRIFACHLAFNQASGRVMEKAGMFYEGTLKSHHNKDGTLHDMVYYGILKDDYFLEEM
ncbi:MAG: GNAT family N-acetyltransferase [Erysipelothrix sp.]|nr:GNAT family N-acetyltransferase [Erysipelothrix sp.]